jgi:hypothetical protein
MYRALRDTTVAKFGEAHFEAWDRTYSFFVGLFAAGKLGGARIVGANASKMTRRPCALSSARRHDHRWHRPAFGPGEACVGRPNGDAVMIEIPTGPLDPS